MRVIRLFPFFFLFLLLVQCAQMSRPKGGPKDKQPPKVVRTSPRDKSTNFRAVGFQIEFDEFIEFNNLQRQLLISPPMEEDPEITIKKRTMLVKLQDSLLPNTTYTFNFGSGIADITEMNATRNLKYTFSTGPVLDTLVVDGQVRVAKDLKEAEDILVMLYPSQEDSLPMKEKPYYVSKTDLRGEFNIENIKAGQYKVFALKDGNYNYLYDLPTEDIAFLDSSIRPVVPDSTASLDLRLFREKQEDQFLSRVKTDSRGRLTMLYGIPPSAPGFKMIQPNKLSYDTLREMNTLKDSVTYWFQGVDSTDTLMIAPFDGDSILDTVEVVFQGAGEEKQEEPFTLSTNLKNPHPPFEKVLLESPVPIDSMMDRPVRLVKDTDTVVVDLVKEGNLNRIFSVEGNFKADSSYQLLVPGGKFIDIFGFPSDTLEKPVQMDSRSSFGTIQLQLELADSLGHPFLLQLREKGKPEILEERVLENGGTVDFGPLSPGKYEFKLIYDRNGNERWDPGKYLEHRQPEQVMYYSKEVKVRSNWDLEAEWKVTSP